MRCAHCAKSAFGQGGNCLCRAACGIMRTWGCKRLANIKSARKRVLISETNRLRNRSVRSTVHTAVRQFEGALGSDASAADREQAFRDACSEVDKSGECNRACRNRC